MKSNTRSVSANKASRKRHVIQPQDPDFKAPAIVIQFPAAPKPPKVDESARAYDKLAQARNALTQQMLEMKPEDHTLQVADLIASMGPDDLDVVYQFALLIQQSNRTGRGKAATLICDSLSRFLIQGVINAQNASILLREGGAQ